MANSPAKSSNGSNHSHFRFLKPARPSLSYNTPEQKRSLRNPSNESLKQIMRKMSRIREFALEQPPQRINNMQMHNDRLPQFSKMVKYLPEEIVIEERKARTDIRSAEKSSIIRNQQRLEELRNRYKDRSGSSQAGPHKIRYRNLKRKKMNMHTEPTIMNTDQQTYLDIYQKYLDEKTDIEQQLCIGTPEGIALEGENKLSNIRLKSGEIKLKIIESLKESIQEQSRRTQQSIYQSQYRSKALRNKDNRLNIKKNSLNPSFRKVKHKSITELVYQNFCMKYRDYASIREYQQRTINQNFSSYRKQKNRIIQEMKRQGVSQEKQFRVISEINKNYQEMSNALTGGKAKRELTHAERLYRSGNFSVQELGVGRVQADNE